MSITQTQTTSFKLELYEGVHNFLVDEIRIALYTAAADLGPNTTEYTTAGEVSGGGYTATGQVLTGVVVRSQDTVAFVNFDNATWNPAAFTCRGALIYNASKANRSIAVLDFGSDKTCSTTFTVQMPVAGPTTALIRSSN